MSETPTEPTERAVELSVVVAAYNAAATIEDQLNALLAQEWDGTWEIVVADNGSTDDTRGVVGRIAAADPRVRLVDATDRRGPAHARNLGVQSARGDSVAFCDADDVVGIGWLRAIGDALRQAGLVTGPQEYERLNPPWLHGVYGTVPAREMQTFSGVFSFGPAANLGVRRGLFEKASGFDPSLEVGEDIDLCLRLWLQGAQLEFVPDAIVHYRYREGLRALGRQAVEYGTAAPETARRLAAAGRPTPSRWRGTRNWLWLVRNLPSLRSRAGRARWVVVAGGCAGRILGSMRSRYLLL